MASSVQDLFQFSNGAGGYTGGGYPNFSPYDDNNPCSNSSSSSQGSEPYSPITPFVPVGMGTKTVPVAAPQAQQHNSPSPPYSRATSYPYHPNSGNSVYQMESNINSNYLHLTSWTTKLANEGFPVPSSVNSLTVPVVPSRRTSLPAATAPIHLTSRMRRVAPYPNAFSRLSPIQSRSMSSDSNSSSNSISSVSNASSAVEKVSEPTPTTMLSKENRFRRTAEALQNSGLWDIAMKTGNLIKQNQELQKELDQFKMDALNFLKSVIKNPQNRDFIKNILNTAITSNVSEGKKPSVMNVVVSVASAVVSTSASCDQAVWELENDPNLNKTSQPENEDQ